MADLFVDSESSAEKKLSHTEATLRKQQISDVRYDLKLHLIKGAATYAGSLLLSFSHSDPQAGTFLDCVSKEFSKIVLNGKEVSPKDNTVLFKGNRVHLPGQLLQAKNTLSITYVNNYDHHGEGFHQFIDPEDKQEYIYTNFEPFEAHRLLPCFDQPSIKASYAIQVTVEGDNGEWKVLANYPLRSVLPTQDGKGLVYTFEETPKFSTYLLAIVVGPFTKYEDIYVDETTKQKIPLGILCRKSMTKYLNPDLDELFTVTKQGLKFYNEFFGIPYAFAKYDQIFTPEFNWGAMENVGCVTFTENYIFRDVQATEAQRQRRSDTVLHEMAHMWFGDLVSPLWWDGLWLNESFATYMSSLASSLSSERFGKLAWQAFNSGMKAWAYREDQVLATTHSIQGKVDDTTQCFLNFDGITYGKGASVLKQLVAVLGLDRFRDGMRIYFRKFQWGNTSISDFIGALQEAVNKSGEPIDLSSWADEWLHKPGLNTLELQVERTGDNLTGLKIVQTAPAEYPTLRHHKLEIALFDENPETKKVVVREILKVTTENSAVTQIPLSDAIKSAKAPAFVFFNYNDHAFAKLALDPHSLDFARTSLEKIDDSLLRQMLWAVFYDSCRDASGLKSQDYLRLVREKVTTESDKKLIQTILDRASACVGGFVPIERLESESDALFDLAWKQLNAATDAELKTIWARFCVSNSRSQKTISALLDVIDGKTSVEGGYSFDQSMRWSLIQKAIAHNISGAVARLEAEEAKDKGDRGKRAVITARSSVPDKAVKAEAWKRYVDWKEGGGLSLHDMEADFSGFRWKCQAELTKEYDREFFKVARQIVKEKPKEYAKAFLELLFPSNEEDEEIVTEAEKLIASCGEDEKLLKRTLQEDLDALLRVRKCIKYARS